MSWTEERVEALRLHWAAGLSCSSIANELGGVTRNAVIGKLHRLGLAGRGKGKSQEPLRPQPQSKATRHYKHKPVPVPAPWRIKQPSICDLPPETVANPVGFVELEAHHCRWPVDGAGYQMLFCGADRLKKRPYCARHCRMAYRAPERRA